jgi:hypothetical protein
MLLPLTKSDYLVYRACPPELWYAKHRPELFAAPPSEEDLFAMRQGQAVEVLGRRYLEKIPYLEVAFQQTFDTGALLARADAVLTDTVSGMRTLVEIKSGTEVKEEYLHDLAFQAAAARDAGAVFDRYAVLHVNRDYVHTTPDIHLDAYFLYADVTEPVEALAAETRRSINEALAFLEQDEPDVPLHTFCDKKLDCPAIRHRHAPFPPYTVFNIGHIRREVLRGLLQRGIVDIRHVPADVRLSDRQRREVRVAQSNEPHIDRQAVRRFREALRFPLYFLDYETLNYGIPLYHGLKPYQQLPFQWSLHVVRGVEAEPEHHAFLSDGSRHPALDFVEALRRAIPDDGGHVVVWNQTFETGRNRELAAMFPEHRAFLEGLNARVVDLMAPFQKHDYLHPGFRGSYSIKNVLPVLVPHLSYQHLTISNGVQAYVHWHRIATGDLPEADRERVRAALLDYCRMDTLAMVEVWRRLGEEGN